MAPMEVEIVGMPAGAARVEVGNGVVDWKRPKLNSELVLTGGRGFRLEDGDTLFIKGGGEAFLSNLIAGMGVDPILLHSWLGATGGGGSYRIGWRGELKRLKPKEVAYIPSKDNPVLKLKGT